jgi:purine nucleosidase
MAVSNQRILIDTDPGVDDAMALLLAAASPELDIVGVTTVAGNNPDVALMTHNALALLALAGRGDIPVAQGAAHSLENRRPPVGANVHGKNALGDAKIASSPRKVETQGAAEMIVEKARGGLHAIVTLAPLTNLALALRACPELPRIAPQLSLMGGALVAPGNATPTAESNILNDPEAAKVVFGAWPAILMAGLDITRQAPVGDDFLNRLRDQGNAAGRFLHAASQHYLRFYRGKGESGMHLHDVHAIMVLVRPDI